MPLRPVTGSPVGADARIRPRVDASIDPYACSENYRLQIRGGQRAGRPTTPLKNPCVGRGALTPPKPTAKSLLRSIRRGGIHPSREVYGCRKLPGSSGTPTPTSAPGNRALQILKIIGLFDLFGAAQQNRGPGAPTGAGAVGGGLGGGQA